jgi:hypothetical protein
MYLGATHIALWARHAACRVVEFAEFADGTFARRLRGSCVADYPEARHPQKQLKGI